MKLHDDSICRHMVINKPKDFYYEEQFWRNGMNHIVQAGQQEQSNKLQPFRLLGAFKTYSETDFMELQRIHVAITKRKSIQKLDLEVLCSLFMGYSVISISQQLRLFKMIDELID